MAEPIYRCPGRGYVTGSERADCGADAEKVLSGDRRRRLSKFLSGALRHFPDDAGLELDDRGWTDFDDLVAAATRKYGWAESEHVKAVVQTDPKGRFERCEARSASDSRAGNPRDSDCDRIRAAYGHSVDVTLEKGDDDVPDRLYHGTAPESAAAIRTEGLRPMSRREVHLSETPAEAREVGRRHASDPVVFEVDARRMVEDGRRVTKRGEGVYTANEVPPDYLTSPGDQ